MDQDKNDLLDLIDTLIISSFKKKEIVEKIWKFNFNPEELKWIQEKLLKEFMRKREK